MTGNPLNFINEVKTGFTSPRSHGAQGGRSANRSVTVTSAQARVVLHSILTRTRTVETQGRHPREHRQLVVQRERRNRLSSGESKPMRQRSPAS